MFAVWKLFAVAGQASASANIRQSDTPSSHKTATMPSDSNVVLSASGVPGALIGSAGDLSIDGTTGLVYALAGTWAPAGSISSASSAPATPVLAIANYTAGLLDFLIEVDSTAGPVLITLPDTAAYGHVFRIAWIAGSNAVTVTSTDTASRPIEGDDGLPHISVTLSVVGEVVEHYRSAAIFKRT